MRLGIDPRRGDQMVRGVTNLPHGTGREPKVAIFTSQDSELAARAGGAFWPSLVHCLRGISQARHCHEVSVERVAVTFVAPPRLVPLPPVRARACVHAYKCVLACVCVCESTCALVTVPTRKLHAPLLTRPSDIASSVAGADVVGGEELISRIQEQGSAGIAFDKCLATPDIMPRMVSIARILGPRGLMPNPKVGTIVDPQGLPEAVRAIKAGRVEYRLVPALTLLL